MARKAHVHAPMVLVVDDEAGMQQYLRRALEMEYCAVETVSSGRDALDRVRTGVIPDLILLDVEMPGLNGLETLQQLLRSHPQLKIIMCSCRDDADTIGKAHTLGAQAYLAKPFRQVQLAAALQRCLRYFLVPSTQYPVPSCSSSLRWCVWRFYMPWFLGTRY